MRVLLTTFGACTITIVSWILARSPQTKARPMFAAPSTWPHASRALSTSQLGYDSGYHFRTHTLRSSPLCIRTVWNRVTNSTAKRRGDTRRLSRDHKCTTAAVAYPFGQSVYSSELAFPVSPSPSRLQGHEARCSGAVSPRASPSSQIGRHPRSCRYRSPTLISLVLPMDAVIPMDTSC